MMRSVFAAVAILLALPAVAPAQQSRIMRDCRDNAGVVTGQYPVGELRAAYRAIAPARRVSDDCGQSIASHIAARPGAPKGGREAGPVLEDCTRHGGRLTLRYAPHALTRAATRMSVQRREQTRCLIGIYSQLRARKRPIAVTRPGLTRVAGPYNDQAAAELFSSLQPFTAALRQDPQPYDAVPQNIEDLLVRRNENNDDGFLGVSLRRVGPGDTPVWLVLAHRRMCAVRWYGDTIRPDLICLPANRWARGEALLTVRTHSDGTHDVWGVAPDQFSDGRLLFGAGEPRELTTNGNGVLDFFEEAPGAIEWTADGREQWFDPTTVPCKVHCLEVPRV